MRANISRSPSIFSIHPQGLLDFSKEFDVSLLDKVAMAFYTGRGQEVCLSVHPSLSGALTFPQQQMAQQVLTQLEEHPDAWTRVPEIMERSTFQQSKVYPSRLPSFFSHHPFSTSVSKFSKNSSPHAGKPSRMVSGKVSTVPLRCDASLILC